MTRINTNVSSLNAQKTLARSNAMLQESLTRLSTGLRINTGKDDPAGLIASETLRADIVSVERAITNSQRANQMISTADSALGQVSALLNDIRGLVSEAANDGAMSSEQIAANQLQVDSSLEAIDRISQVTQFQGNRLLDGNLDFITSGVDNSQITGMQIDQANFGSLSQIDLAIDVVAQATQGELTYAFGAVADDVTLEIGGKTGFEAFNFAAGSTIEDMAAAINLVSDALGVSAEVETEATAGAVTASSFGADNDITITADSSGFDEGNIRIKYSEGTPGAALNVNYTAASGSDAGTIEVELATAAWVASSGEINEAGVTDNALAITANIKGTEFDGVTIVASDTGGAITLGYDHSTKVLAIGINTGVSTAGDLITAFSAAGNEDVGELFSIANVGESDGTGLLTFGGMNTAGLTTAGGVDGGAITSTANDVVTELNKTVALGGAGDDITAALATGNDGYEVVTAFQESTSYGAAVSNDQLQFLGGADSRDIRFVSSPDQALSVDLSTDPRVETFSSATIQGITNVNSTFTVTARQKGEAYDGVAITITDNAGLAADTVVWDPEGKTLVFDVDVTGAGTTADALVTLLNTDSYASEFFRGANYGTSTGAGDVTIAMAGTTAGGLSSEGTAIVNLATNADGVITTTAQDLIDYFDDTANAAALGVLGMSITNAEGSDGSGVLAATSSDLAFATSGTDMQDAQAAGTTNAVNGEAAQFTVTAVEPGVDFNDVVIEFEDTGTAGSETVVYDSVAKKLTIGIESGTSTATQVVAAITGDATVSALFTSAVVNGGGSAVTDSDGGLLSGGQVDNGSSDGAALVGNEDAASTGLKFTANEYGADSFVSVTALSGSFAVTDAAGTSSTRSSGTDVSARINGIQAIGDGLSATINTSALDLSFSIDSGVASGSSLSFSITGGGARFQLGPDVVSNQQARIGIASVNTAKLGGVSGRLFELRSGQARALDGDVNGAASIVEEVISQVTTLRGRLGAFQRTTLDVNIATLGDTLESLTAAESDIRDADFAKESAQLTKAQILVQSGLSVLGIANQNPQSVLSLIR